MRLIDADDKTLNRNLSYYTCYTGIDEAPYEYATQELDNSPTVPAIPIPDNATNGDMLQAIFPNCVIDTDSCGDITTSIDEKMYWSKKWWNSPYKRGDTE